MGIKKGEDHVMKAIQFINTSPKELIEELGEFIEGRIHGGLEKMKLRKDDELLTHKEAADFLKIHATTLHRLKKHIKFHRTGNRLKYKRSNLEVFLKLQSLKESQNLNPIKQTP